MQQVTGKHIIACYDKYGHKVKKIERDNYALSLTYAHDWEKEHEGNTAVISRILYNSVSNNEKWSYHGKGK